MSSQQQLVPVPAAAPASAAASTAVVPIAVMRQKIIAFAQSQGRDGNEFRDMPEQELQAVYRFQRLILEGRGATEYSTEAYSGRETLEKNKEAVSSDWNSGQDVAPSVPMSQQLLQHQMQQLEYQRAAHAVARETGQRIPLAKQVTVHSSTPELLAGPSAVATLTLVESKKPKKKSKKVKKPSSSDDDSESDSSSESSDDRRSRKKSKKSRKSKKPKKVSSDSDDSTPAVAAPAPAPRTASKKAKKADDDLVETTYTDMRGVLRTRQVRRSALTSEASMGDDNYDIRADLNRTMHEIGGPEDDVDLAVEHARREQTRLATQQARMQQAVARSQMTTAQKMRGSHIQVHEEEEEEDDMNDRLAQMQMRRNRGAAGQPSRRSKHNPRDDDDPNDMNEV